jgi:hypothetical protein
LKSIDEGDVWNGHTSDRRRTAIALLISGSLAALLTIATYSLSARIGRLATPLTFDDIGYALSGSEIYNIFASDSKLEAILMLLQAHAPLQSALAVLAVFLFVPHDWAIYAVNAWMLLALVIVVLWIARPLPLLPQLAVVLVVLCTPVTANVLVEFRPDLWWGLLCGLAAYLIFDPRFLRGSRPYQVFTVIVVALALLGKPSASPSTVIFLGYAATAAVLLTLRVDKGRRTGTKFYRRRFGLFLLTVALLIAPYYLQNIGAVYDYLHQSFVTEIDIWRERGDLWHQLAYYPLGQVSRSALNWTFWLGLFVFPINVAILWKAKKRAALLRYLAYAAAVFAAYSAPTISPIKSYYLGGMFYGTFLLFTVHSLVLIFLALQSRSYAATRAAAGLLIVLCIAAYQPVPLFARIDPQDAADNRNLSDQLIAAIAREIRKVAPKSPPTVFVPAPYPVSDLYLQLRLQWQGMNIRVQQPYHISTIQEQLSLLRGADFAVLTEASGSHYHGERLSPELIKIAKADESLVQVLDFEDSRGRHTFLFKRVSKDG